MPKNLCNTSRLEHNGFSITRVSSSLCITDHIGNCKVRWDLGRMKYIIEPGIYAIGNPDSNSPVMVTANYKLSFDMLRKNLNEINAWILVLDTKGINVWCAAGKGTFGTDELIHRINDTRLKDIVDHKNIIVPQLGAPGVSGYEVTKQTGFKVTFGPVKAEDLPEFLNNNYQATPEMRKVMFPVKDRLVLIPVEFVTGLKYLIFAALCLLLLAGLNPEGYSSSYAIERGVPGIIILTLAYLSGTILGPLLLPLLPAKAFSLKGLYLGILCYLLIIVYNSLSPLYLINGKIASIAWFLIIITINSFILMNFTGASTYTSLSGVRKEMQIAVPLQIICFICGTILWLTSLFFI